MSNDVYQMSEHAEAKVLRTKAIPYAFTDHTPAATRTMIDRMKRVMHEAQGIGLSANQIGLPWSVFVGQISNAQGKPKFYALFNPKLAWHSEESSGFEEGCLSVPGQYGTVVRPERIIVEAFDKQGRPVKIKAWGLLARMFQHEIDHLNGIVFIDKAKHLHESK